MVRYSVVFLIPYFGKLPPYFDAFLLSISNKNFDIIFFSDNHSPAKLPSNCKWHYYGFNELCDWFENKLEISVALNHSRKLCDFKPALGFIFQDYIKEYTFWGSADLDVCIGNFDKYLNDALLETMDVFSGIKEYLSGSFFIIRNTAYHNNLFKKSKDWQYAFQTNENVVFDECGGNFFKELRSGKTFGEIRPPIESFTEVLFKELPTKTRLVFINIIAEPKKGNTCVDANAVIYNDEEFLLVHFIYYKTWYSFYTNKKIAFPFYINRLGFFQNKPMYLNELLSKNFWFAFLKKIEINLMKLKLHV